MAQREWVHDGDGRSVYRVVRTEETEDDRERAQRAVAAILADRDQHPDGLELADGESTTTITVAGEEVPAPTDETPNGRLRRFVYLKARLRALEAETAAVKAESRELDHVLQDAWGDDGVSRVTLDGVTAYLYPVSHVEKVNDATPADIRDALTRSGYGYMLEPNYSGSALKALLKEWDNNGQEMPAPLAEVVKLVTNHEIRLRAATAPTRAAKG